MIIKKLSIFIACALALCSCATNSVTVETEDGGRVRVSAVDDAIIRVEAVPAGVDFSQNESLVVVLDRSKGPKCDIVKTDSTVSLVAPAVTAEIRRKDGRVAFYRPDGSLITSESCRSFTPIEVEGSKGFSVSQNFVPSAQKEGFYGLGQHQADEWNYADKGEELYQYNTKISVPVIVSNHAYGILWDSYSLCRFGDSSEYAPLGDIFTLYDKNGVEGALTGTYIPAKGAKLVRREESLSQEYLDEPQLEKVHNAPDFEFQGSKVIYEGSLQAPTDGEYRFLLYYAGYTTVYVDGVQVMPTIWRTAWNPNARKFTFPMQAGKRHSIRIEWNPDGNVSYCGLRALGPDTKNPGMRWWGEMQQELDYYFMAADDMDGVIAAYRRLSGKAPVMPKWSLGYWQSRERYRTQDEIVSTLAEFRSRHIPVDNIVQDWQYWEDDQWGSHEFAAERFPDPQAMLDSIHALGGRYMISVWPKFYVGTEHFNELDANGWIYPVPVRDTVRDWLGYEQSFYDAYAPGARKMFWKQMEDHLFHLGVDAWWMDASEPNIHDCTNMDYRKAMCGPTALGTSTEYFNAYALVNAQAIYEGQRASAPSQRVFLLTRNGFAGLQRYSTASWSGDIGTRWEDMKAQISAGLNYSLSGIPWWGQDIGGFSVENRYSRAQQIFDATGVVNADLLEWRELNARWHQWGFLTPLYRSHGQWPCREPWNIAPEGTDCYNSILDCNHMRYALMPYIYSLAARVHFDDYSVMRALVMDYPCDEVAMNISDQFMFGDAIMVCPVYEYGARTRRVYLPAGVWYEMHTSQRYESAGAYFDVPAPYEYSPLFVRGGSVLPTGPALEYTVQAQDGSLEFTIYDDACGYSSYLYEDDGLSYDYERGEYAKIPYSWDGSKLVLGERTGSYKGMFQTRPVKVSLVDGAGKRTLASFEYNGNKVIITK